MATGTIESADFKRPNVESNRSYKKAALASIVAGGLAGMSIDAVLFPADSIKTRIQASSRGTGDFTCKAHKISKFKGLPSSMVASFPCAATFWLTYETTKSQLQSLGIFSFSVNNMLAASVSECLQSLIRTPSEVIK